MAEKRVVFGTPVNALKRELEDIGAYKWCEKNTHIKGEYIERTPPRTGTMAELEILKKGPSPVGLEVIPNYGNYSRCVIESVASVMTKVAWNVLALMIYEKVRLLLTGYGAPLCNDEYILIPLYFGSVAAHSSMFLKTTRNEATDVNPYESLRDSLLASVSTLRFVRKSTDIPVPHVYTFFTEGPDTLEINRPWMIIERMPGEPLKNMLANLNIDRAQKIGDQLGALFSKLIAHSFNSIGSLKITGKGLKFEVGPIASDPNGRPLSLNHYRRRGRVGCVELAHQKYKSVEEYFLNTANYAVLALINSLNDTVLPQGDISIWDIWQYVHLRHLHVFFAEFKSTTLLKNCFILDTSAFHLENIHVDAEFNICGIIDWDGVNIKPIHLAMQLPRPLESVKSYWNNSTNPLTSAKTMVLKRAFELQVASALVTTGLLKIHPTEALNLSPIWESFARAKDYERTLYCFTGAQNKKSIEWQAYTDFADAKWISNFGRYPDFRSEEYKDLRRFMQQKWAVVEDIYDVPIIPGFKELVRQIAPVQPLQRSNARVGTTVPPATMGSRRGPTISGHAANAAATTAAFRAASAARATSSTPAPAPARTATTATTANTPTTATTAPEDLHNWDEGDSYLQELYARRPGVDWSRCNVARRSSISELRELKTKSKQPSHLATASSRFLEAVRKIF